MNRGKKYGKSRIHASTIPNTLHFIPYLCQFGPKYSPSDPEYPPHSRSTYLIKLNKMPTKEVKGVEGFYIFKSQRGSGGKAKHRDAAQIW